MATDPEEDYLRHNYLERRRRADLAIKKATEAGLEKIDREANRRTEELTVRNRMITRFLRSLRD